MSLTKELPIQMVDLQQQHARIEAELEAAMGEVIRQTSFIRGPQVGSFEKELADYLHAGHVIGCANGTDALQLALMALDLPQGAEVITTTFTFVATAEAIKLLGLTPVLVDIDADSFLMDLDQVESLITERTAAIMPVHLFGQCVDMVRLMAIAEKHNLYVIEDMAQAIGAECRAADGSWKKAGTIGHIGCTSFFPSKNLGCMGDGGAVFTNDDALAKRLRSIANHGQGTQYMYERVGINSRLDSLQAAILSVKLPHLDSYNELRQIAARDYTRGLHRLPGLQAPVLREDSTHIFHQYTLRVTNGKREELMAFLAENDIPSRVYYPVPLHQHLPYQEGNPTERFPVAERLMHEVMSLPMHTELTTGQITYITNKIQQFWEAP